jgi:hypothetical protein
MVLLVSAVICMPLLFKYHVVLTEKFVIEEDAAEALLIAILLLTAFLISNAYQSELKKSRHEISRLTNEKSDLSDKLLDAFHYIGEVNVQIQEFRSMFSGVRRYPRSKNDFKDIVDSYARTILGIVNADWVVIRMINRNNFRTIKEQTVYRRNVTLPNYHISNKAIILNQNINEYCIVGSRQENLTIKVVCILREKMLGIDEKVLVEAIMNQLEMLYIVYISRECKEIYLSQNP